MVHGIVKVGHDLVTKPPPPPYIYIYIYIYIHTQVDMWYTVIFVFANKSLFFLNYKFKTNIKCATLLKQEKIEFWPHILYSMIEKSWL